MTGIAVVELEIVWSCETVTSLIWGKGEEDVYGCMREVYLTSSTWLENSKSSHWEE